MFELVRNVPGYIYLLHFHQPYKHARHYSGWALDLEERLKEHGKAHGARLLEVAAAAGITWELAWVEVGDRYRERQLKQRGAARRCPICRLSKEVIPMYEKNWRHKAACRGIEDPSIFFPIDVMWSQPGNEDNIRAAKAMCRSCPVAAECLEWAIESGERYAIAGGMTPEERRKLEQQVA